MLPPPTPRVSSIPLPACGCCGHVENTQSRSLTEDLISKVHRAKDLNVSPESVDRELREWASPPVSSLSRPSISPRGPPPLHSESSSSSGFFDIDAANPIVHTGSSNVHDRPASFEDGSHYTVGHSSPRPSSQHHYNDQVPRSCLSPGPSFSLPEVPTLRMENALGLFYHPSSYSSPQVMIPPFSSPRLSEIGGGSFHLASLPFDAPPVPLMAFTPSSHPATEKWHYPTFTYPATNISTSFSTSEGGAENSLFSKFNTLSLSESGHRLATKDVPMLAAGV
ncbi:uncharacterized protein TRAVEDRAFT_47566 [Trametes versicolor FP-101664 SS1]|uniref:uncharacterized protein n=1 Tax=Trametes versicolor (strain FP-101664) TaxID=717944 RepID=UPI0004621702|nr:uncharacterized protein TRAVEDRAFT_47566 [Trametes versicolor FP-101664 SS1]EIW58413.1 hypothetical protein TRAVEDRAFT_47566 [Trametes versicolor FP-101664 SS1]